MENNRNVLIVCVWGGGEGATMKCGGGGVGGGKE